MVSRLNELTP